MQPPCMAWACALLYIYRFSRVNWIFYGLSPVKTLSKLAVLLSISHAA